MFNFCKLFLKAGNSDRMSVRFAGVSFWKNASAFWLKRRDVWPETPKRFSVACIRVSCRLKFCHIATFSSALQAVR